MPRNLGDPFWRRHPRCPHRAPGTHRGFSVTQSAAEQLRQRRNSQTSPRPPRDSGSFVAQAGRLRLVNRKKAQRTQRNGVRRVQELQEFRMLYQGANVLRNILKSRTITPQSSRVSVPPCSISNLFCVLVSLCEFFLCFLARG